MSVQEWSLPQQQWPETGRGIRRWASSTRHQQRYLSVHRMMPTQGYSGLLIAVHGLWKKTAGDMDRVSGRAPVGLLPRNPNERARPDFERHASKGGSAAANACGLGQRISEKCRLVQATLERNADPCRALLTFLCQTSVSNPVCTAPEFRGSMCSRLLKTTV